MVRFIIFLCFALVFCAGVIYIPIWLDLLYSNVPNGFFYNLYLHSNMVRFIINAKRVEKTANGNLHSNMVRFIITPLMLGFVVSVKFTFQYG